MQPPTTLVVHSASQGSGVSAGNLTRAPAPVHLKPYPLPSMETWGRLGQQRDSPRRAQVCAMPHNTGIGMPRKRKRAVAEPQMAPDAAANEPDQDSTGGRTSPSTSELPLDEDENGPE